MGRSVVVAIAEGLHARPAALFVAEAGKQPVPVTVRKGDAAPVQAASILGIMTLGAAAGETLVLATEADGPDAEASLDALEAFLSQVEIA
jgi:phosphocarrier protein